MPEESLLADIDTLIKRVLPTQWPVGFEPNFDEPDNDVNHGGNLRKPRQKAPQKAKAQPNYGIKKPRI